MNRTMITATNSLSQLQKQIETISNNIANIDTTGYKRREATFTELMYQQFNNQGRLNEEQNRLTPNGIRQGTGAKVAQTQIDLTQGSIKQTNRSLDTAFTKEGLFYKVLIPTEQGNEVQYTRDGAFYVTPVGEDELALVNRDGHYILDENNEPIYLVGDIDEFQIDEQGRLVTIIDNQVAQEFELGVVQVNKPQFLESKGNNLLGLPVNFAELGVELEAIVTDLVGPLRTEIAIQQRALEQSNVDLAKEMTDLMNAQRAYQFQSRSISIADQMQGLVNGIR